jgi:FkbM family methyltransferase
VLGPYTEALLINSYNGSFLVDVEDQMVGDRLISDGEYERNEVERILSYTNESSNVLVVGGHIGTIVVPLAKKCRSVTVIEANPQTFRLLSLNLVINKCSNAEAFNVAANDKREQIQFLLNRSNSGGSKRMPLIRNYMYFSDSPEVTRVDSVRLDELLKEHEFDVIVMDIEGSEYFALRGMQDILAKSRALSMEFTPHHLRNVSGITVERLLQEITPHFNNMFVPTRNITVSKDRFNGTLQEMYDREERDDGIIFTK